MLGIFDKIVGYFSKSRYDKINFKYVKTFLDDRGIKYSIGSPIYASSRYDVPYLGAPDPGMIEQLNLVLVLYEYIGMYNIAQYMKICVAKSGCIVFVFKDSTNNQHPYQISYRCTSVTFPEMFEKVSRVYSRKLAITKNTN